MAKPLCELKKTLKRDMAAYLELVQDATHVCKKCGRCANDPEVLCKPLKIAKALALYHEDEERVA